MRFIVLPLLVFILQTSGIQQPASAQQTQPLLLTTPWSGGLNSCQFCPIDINCDGTDDLLIFDRHGNRLLPYLHTPWGFEAAPEFAVLFPDIHDWVISADYNCDGKMDLFTYSLGGTRVFENTSTNSLKFRLVTDMVKSYYYSGFIGILETPVDYPAIADLDHDGDLDLLTFFGLGSFVEYHKNLSMEHFGNCDSLDFMLTDHCWGNFKESEGSNRISLAVTCPYKFSNEFTCTGMNGDNPPKHTGSTLVATDLNGDGLNDLLLGDIDFPNLIALINGGTPDSASMTGLDTLFPSGDLPVRLFSFPAVALIDIDDDGVRDMLVSPFDPNLVISENRKSIWFYRNFGTNGHPDFRFVTDRLFLQDMLDFGSGSAPVLYDLNNDGLTDLLVGNFGTYDSSWYDQGMLHSSFTGKISYFRNTGASFSFVTSDLTSAFPMSLQGVYPAFGDVNGDGFHDMITGNSDGTLLCYLNSGVPSDPPVFLPPIVKYMNIDVGAYSAPQLFDLDGDGLRDLVIGEQAGNLNYYRNKGTPVHPVFTLVTDSLGKINVTHSAFSLYGYSIPCLFRNTGGETCLMVGSEEGKIHYYKDIDGNLAGSFTASDSLFESVGIPSKMPAIGWRSAPAVGHVTDPEKMDLIAGNFSGGLNYFSAQSFPTVIPGITERTGPAFEVVIYPNPANDLANLRVTGIGFRNELFVEVLTTSGIRIYGKNTTSETTIPVASWAEGCYIVKVTASQGGTVCRKLVVIH